MYSLVLKVSLVYLCLLYWLALHGSSSSTCTCTETCTNTSADQAAMPCLFHANHAALTAGRLPNEAVCSNYDVFPDPVTQDPICDFVGTSDPVVDMCQPDGSLCIAQNPSQKTQSCQKDLYYCNYLLECPPNQILWVQCTAMDIPHYDEEEECMDEVTLVSPFLQNGKKSICGSTCFTVPEVIPFSMEINYGASDCCHNYGFSLSTFCSSTIVPSRKKRAVTTDPCLKERITVVPMDGTLQYSNQTIRVIIPSQRKTLTYKDIELLFIEDKRHGNSIYTNTGLDSLQGYGELEIVGYVAYYRYYTIDPSLLPNEEETAFITDSVKMLTNMVRKTTYTSFAKENSEMAVTYDKTELTTAKMAADERKYSSNPFVSGIAKDLLVAIDPLLTNETTEPPTRQY